MEFGMGERVKGGSVSWFRVAQALPHKTMTEVVGYGRLFEFYLAIAEPNTVMLPPGDIPLQSVFMDKRPNEVEPTYIWHQNSIPHSLA